MKNNFVTWLITSLIVMLLFPYLVVTLVKGNAGMAACFVLFFAVNPMYSIFAGIYAGKDSKKLWSLPIIISTLFVLGTWIFFDIGEIAFIMYGVVYLVIGIVTMLISAFINKKFVIKQFNHLQ